MQSNMINLDTPDLKARHSLYMILTLDKSKIQDIPWVRNRVPKTSPIKPKGEFISFNEFNKLLDSNKEINIDNPREVSDNIRYPQTFIDKAHKESVALRKKYEKKAYSLGIVDKDRNVITKATFNKIFDYDGNFSEENTIDVKS